MGKNLSLSNSTFKGTQACYDINQFYVAEIDHRIELLIRGIYHVVTVVLC